MAMIKVVFSAALLTLICAMVLVASQVSAHGDHHNWAPSHLDVSDYTHNSVSLTWDAPHSGQGTITGYRVMRRDVARQDPGNFTEFVSSGKGTAYTDTEGLQPETKYAYRVKPIRSDDESANRTPRRSNFVNVTTRSTPPPATPEPSNDPAPVNPNTLACTAGNDSQWITSRTSFTRSGYTYYGCDVLKGFDTSRGPEKMPRYKVLYCNENWSCWWRNG